ETVVEGTTTEYVTYCPLSSGAEGKTESGEVVVTATACDNDVCHETVVPGTKTTVTTTAPGGETTVYTTYGPASSIETVESSKDITVWACDEQTCHAGTVGATPSTTETVYEGTTSTYVTYCPTTSVLTGGETIVTGAITSSSEIYVPKPTVITSGGKTQSTVSYVSVSKVTVNTETTAATTAGENEQVPSSIVSVTVCNNDICHPTTVIATLTEVTTSVNGAKTTYSTFYPASSIETVESSKVITVVACSSDNCFATTAVATPEVGTTVVEGTTNEYVTYKPTQSANTEASAGGPVFASTVITSEGVPYVPQTTVISSGKSVETSVSLISVSVGTEFQKPSTTIVTEDYISVTSCSEAICVGTTVPAVSTGVTTTVNGVETTYSTMQPVSSVETVESSKVIPVVACSGDKCYATSAIATPSTTNTVIEGTTSEYVTYCPSSASGGEVIATELVTSEGVTYVPQSTVVTSGESSYVSTSYVSVSVATPGTTLASQSSSIATGSSPAISSYAGSASSRGVSILALALIPLGYFI
ncbi:Yeast-form wall Protein 1, partial [Candida tropicalis]